MKKNQMDVLELKNTVPEKMLDGINSRMEMREERVSEHKDSSVQAEQKKIK